MNGSQSSLSFCWWNLHDFAHFDAKLASGKRRPNREEDFTFKRDCILAALRELHTGGYPDLLAVCEITREAATALSRMMTPAFDVTFAPEYPHDDGFQVAIVFRRDFGFSADPPLLAAEDLDVSEETRPMIPVRFTRGGLVIRFVACHWTSFDSPQSQLARRKLADYLRSDTYEFLQPNAPKPRPDHHTVILGDLNVEPTSDIFEQELLATRDHASSRQTHWRDSNQRRVRLYNAAWRFLGEQGAYRGEAPTHGLAGTFFNERLGWRTFDHLIVSGNLLDTPPPYLDEASTRVAVTSSMRLPDGNIWPFDRAHNTGISDHLPIVGKIILPEDAK